VNRAKGMILFDDDLFELFSMGIISQENTLAKANDPEEMNQRISAHHLLNKK
jgi:Tfp pilus assembly ATPase PilU